MLPWMSILARVADGRKNELKNCVAIRRPTLEGEKKTPQIRHFKGNVMGNQGLVGGLGAVFY